MERTINNDLPRQVGQRVKIAGWVHNVRKVGQVNFLLVRDRSAIAQVVLSPEELQPLAELQRETVVEVTGLVQEGPTELGVELHQAAVTVISPVHDVLPFELAKKEVRASLPVFLDHAAVGHRHPRRRAVLTLSAGLMAAFRAGLQKRGFTEIQTPKLVASATESGANVFPVKYFDKTAYLAQSPQFYKQIMVGVFERVYEVAPVFRAEPHSTSRHLNEYVSLDMEMGFIRNHFDVMATLNALLADMMAYLPTHYAGALELLQVEPPRVPAQIPWIYFPEAQNLLIERFSLTDVAGEPDLAPEHERVLGQWAKSEFDSDFLFVTGYPMVKRPFYTHANPDDPAYSNSFDLLFRGLEVVTGGQRLHRYDDYLKAAAAYGYNPETFQEYFEAFKYGMPPHGGFGMGLERLLASLLQQKNVQEVTLFPRDMNRLRP
ncbi:MAG: aspartate--tRNA(Asn) ligase [Chloroflexi bacterium]|nr:aspartate--tRNA(Asn) ligase [Chloroflexota bacterium]MCI0576072.1 aspartate--tRNA(Asn) ligase [Chloroflexota bacterium]MCI0647860.1 aspartate--tRNA(Asn) ligase [Chloroflexota bacterium]MCI0727111.1 aspartate--tRNA(Asn) ligase [Chloroflexota bacterium]